MHVKMNVCEYVLTIFLCEPENGILLERSNVDFPVLFRKLLLFTFSPSTFWEIFGYFIWV